MIYPLDSELAKEIGVLEAIILVQFRYWIERNIANEQNYHDGNWWTYNSMVAFQRMFPFASEKSIRNALKHLEERGLIVTGNYNKLQYDRTKWYALTPLGITHTDNFTDSIRQKGQMETAKRANGNGKKGRPIPNKIPNKETKNISSSLRSEDIYRELPDNLKDALRDFEEMRKLKKKPMTDKARKLLLGKLETLSAGDTDKKIAILNQSIENAWTSVYELKEQNYGNKKLNGTVFGANGAGKRQADTRDRDIPPQGFRFPDPPRVGSDEKA